MSLGLPCVRGLFLTQGNSHKPFFHWQTLPHLCSDTLVMTNDHTCQLYPINSESYLFWEPILSSMLPKVENLPILSALTPFNNRYISKNLPHRNCHAFAACVALHEDFKLNGHFCGRYFPDLDVDRYDWMDRKKKTQTYFLRMIFLHPNDITCIYTYERHYNCIIK